MGKKYLAGLTSLDAMYKNMSKSVPIDYTYFNRIVSESVQTLKERQVVYVFNDEQRIKIQGIVENTTYELLEQDIIAIYPEYYVKTKT